MPSTARTDQAGARPPRPELPAAAVRRGWTRAAMFAAFAAVAAAVLHPATRPWLLVVTAFAAAIAGFVVSVRARGVDRGAWVLLAAGQLANGIGNVGFLDGAPGWTAPWDWWASTCFNTATVLGIVGLFAFVMPARPGRLGRVAVDLCIVVGAAFAVGWHWDLPSRIDGTSGNLALDIMGFLAVVLGVCGVALGPWVWASRRGGERAAPMIAWAGLALSTVGDTGVVLNLLELPSNAAGVCWIGSSMLLVVGAMTVRSKCRLVERESPARTMDAATGIVGSSLLLLAIGGRADGVTQTVVAGVVSLLLVRQWATVRANRKLAGALAEGERHFRTLVEGTGDVMMRVRRDGTIEFANAAATAILGQDPASLVGRPMLDLIDPSHHTTLAAWLRSGGTGRLGPRVEVELARGEDRTRVVSMVACPVADGVILSVREVTEQAELVRQLEVAARWDSLTGLLNRASFDRELAERINGGGDAAVLFCDVDRFKRINDTSGHAAGDAVLIEVAQRMRAGLPGGHLLARFGGDEFAVLLADGTDRTRAVAIGRALQDTVAGTYLVPGPGRTAIELSVTVGLAFGGGDVGASAVMSNADLALYAGKAEARGSLRVFEQPMFDEVSRKVDLEHRLRRALDTGGLALHHQPIVDVSSGEIVGSEALLRWFDERGEVVLPPPAIVELAEACGIDRRLGSWVLGAAVTQAARWAQAGRSLRTAINLSTRQLLDPCLAGEIAATLTAVGLDPCRLSVEITEAAFLDESPVVLANLESLRDLGVRVAIDDFGTGYSSLSYLTRLPVDALKIDRSFTSGLGVDPTRAVLVRTMVNLARDLGLSVTAEGVEEAHQLAALQGFGTPYAQGYLFARPLSPRAFDALLESQAATVVAG
jgi:diguanylate cyclase (GGDEF)-like protein/PAS domain S-box-containing protein